MAAMQKARNAVGGFVKRKVAETKAVRKEKGFWGVVTTPTGRRLNRVATHAIAASFQAKPIVVKGKEIPVEGAMALPAIAGVVIGNNRERKTACFDVLEGLVHAVITRGAKSQSQPKTEVNLDADGRVKSVAAS